MSRKTLVWFGLFVGSTIGSFIPALWGSDIFSFSSIFLSTLGGLAGIWIGFKLGE
jgi:hypothetical protein